MEENSKGRYRQGEPAGDKGKDRYERDTGCETGQDRSDGGCGTGQEGRRLHIRECSTYEFRPIRHTSTFLS